MKNTLFWRLLASIFFVTVGLFAFINYLTDKTQLEMSFIKTEDQQQLINYAKQAEKLYLQGDQQALQDWITSLQQTEKTWVAIITSQLTPEFGSYVDKKFNEEFRLGRGVEVRESYLIYTGGYTNAADLKEERAENLSFSIDYNLAGVGLSANAYYATIDDVITYGEWGETNYTEFNNDGELVNKGVILGVSYNWSALQASVAHNHSVSELNGEPIGGYYDTDLGISTGDHVNTRISYQFSDSLEFGWSGQFVARLTDTHNDVLEKAGYGVHDLYGQWQPLKNDSLKLTLTVSNLFDKQYRDQSTFGPTIYGAAGDMTPGRDMRIGLAWAL